MDDAAVLQYAIEVVAGVERVTFEYVFGSDECNEFVGSSFSDVFGLLVNGRNCAVVGDPPVPVSINTINNDIPGTAQSNPGLYVNNDPFHPDSTGATLDAADLLDTQMDGLTTVLTCELPVHAGTNTVKLAIGDVADDDIDSWVLLGALAAIPGNQPPTVGAGGPYAGTEGADIPATGTATDADGDPLTTAWSAVPGPDVDPGAACTFADPSALATTVTCDDDGTYTRRLSADDSSGPVVAQTTLTVANAAPVVPDVQVPSEPVLAGAPVLVAAAFTD